MNILAKTKLNIPTYMFRNELKFAGDFSTADKNYVYGVYDFLGLQESYQIIKSDWLDDNTSGLFEADKNIVYISNKNESIDTVIAHEFRHAYQKENKMVSWLSYDIFDEEQVQSYWTDYLEVDAFNFELWYCFEQEYMELPILMTDYGIENMADNKEEIEELLWKRYDIIGPRLKKYYM